MTARNVALVNLACCVIGYLGVGVLFDFHFIDPDSPLLGSAGKSRADILHLFYRKAFGLIRCGQFMVAVLFLLNLVMCILASDRPHNSRDEGLPPARTPHD